MSIPYLKYFGYDNKEDAVCKVEVSIITGPVDKYHRTVVSLMNKQRGVC